MLLPLIGGRQIIAQDGDDSLRTMQARLRHLNDHLKLNRFLVGEQVTLADLFVVGILSGAYMGFRKMMAADYPDITKWFDVVYNIPMYKEVAGELPMFDLPFPASSGESAVSNAG